MLIGYLFFLTNSILFAQVNPAKEKILERTVNDNKYSLFIPKAYFENPTQKDRWPLIIGLHGYKGEAKGHLSLWFYPAKRKGYFVACPQIDFDKDRNLNENFIKSMIREIISEYPIDSERIFLTGHSAGAHFSFYLAFRNPNMFKAIVPVSGMIRDWAKPYASGAKNLNFYMIQGTKDTINTLSESKEALSILKRNKANVIYETYDGGHEYPRDINDKIMEWFEGLR